MHSICLTLFDSWPSLNGNVSSFQLFSRSGIVDLGFRVFALPGKVWRIAWRQTQVQRAPWLTHLEEKTKYWFVYLALIELATLYYVKHWAFQSSWWLFTQQSISQTEVKSEGRQYNGGKWKIKLTLNGDVKPASTHVPCITSHLSFMADCSSHDQFELLFSSGRGIHYCLAVTFTRSYTVNF